MVYTYIFFMLRFYKHVFRQNILMHNILKLTFFRASFRESILFQSKQIHDWLLYLYNFPIYERREE